MNIFPVLHRLHLIINANDKNANDAVNMYINLFPLFKYFKDIFSFVSFVTLFVTFEI